MMPREKFANLATLPLFQPLEAAALRDLLVNLQWVSLSGGEILFRAGDAGDSMYVVLSGRLRVSVRRSDGREEVIREIARGESVGELALLTGEARSATIRAIRDSELVLLSRSAFERAIKSDPTLIRRIAMQLASRQRQDVNDTLARGDIRTVIVLPVVPNHDANNFAGLLTDALARIGPTLHVSRESLQTQSGLAFSESTENSMEDSQLTSRLNALEAQHRAVVYQADADITAWTKRCVRQADLILVVGVAGSPVPAAQLTRLQEYFDSRSITARIELVLLRGRERATDVATSKWLALLRAAAHHHIIPTDQADVARLVRFITGNAVGLVLSGGGARGFAHIGVIRALDERGIPVDYIGGTSMGAVIAAQHALGWDWQTMVRVNRAEWPRCEPQKNYTLPLVALNSARRMDHMLRSMFGIMEIQNLQTKFFCVSTNLTTANAKIHGDGLLWKAVRASVSIPGIGPPAIENGEILVDGGLVDNLPVEAMKKLCPGQVYAVDVSEQVAFRSRLAESYTVSGWKLLWQQLNPFADKP
ncbi:MAG TPA: patatin-like phospholipase family protein, partial [Acidobacteriota bacterium]|nr:patatin-like phospholipase family protein [Acidobacteriota bacterium]